MAARLSFLIPHRSDHGPRDVVLLWNKLRLTKLFPDCDIIIGECDADKPFNRGQAINNAFKQSDSEFVVIVDGDTIFDEDTLLVGLEEIEFHPWIIPYDRYFRLNEASTFWLLLENQDLELVEQELEILDAIYADHQLQYAPPVSGLLLLRSVDFKETGGFDERFSGWGGEDNAFVALANTYIGPYYRTHGAVYHMHHPRKPDFSEPTWAANANLMNKYLDAAENRERMDKLRRVYV
jgi:GT2 family glycosyltransferase